MRWSKIHSKDKAKVITSKVADPDKSLRQIEKETWVNYSTAWKIIKQNLPKLATHSEEMARLVDLNTEIINLGKKRLMEDIKSAEVKSWTDRASMNKIIDDAFKQSQLITWWNTENIQNKNIEMIEIVKPEENTKK